jgi:hypothetical protein
MNDIVITYDSRINTEERLKRILRAVEERCEGFNEIVLVGDKPDWIRGIIHVGFSNLESERFKLKEQYRKLKAVSLNDRVTENFIWIDSENVIPFFNAKKAFRVSISTHDENFNKPKGTDKIALAHTTNIMIRRGFNFKNNYFNRFPMTLNKKRLMNTFDDIDFETAYGYCIKTLYANFNRLNPTSGYVEPLSLSDFENPSSYERNP